MCVCVCVYSVCVVFVIVSNIPPLFSPTDLPKIRLPRELRTKYIRKVGDTLNLVIPFQVCGLSIQSASLSVSGGSVH